MLLGAVTPSSHVPCNSIFGPDCTVTDGPGGSCMQKTLVAVTDPADNDYKQQLATNPKLVVGYKDLVPKCESKDFQDKIALKGMQYTDDMTTMVWKYEPIQPQFKTPENPLKGLLEMINNGQKAFSSDMEGYIDPNKYD